MCLIKEILICFPVKQQPNDIKKKKKGRRHMIKKPLVVKIFFGLIISSVQWYQKIRILWF